MVDWNSLARRKYDIMQQQANASTTNAQASQLDAQTRAGLAPATADLSRAQTGQVLAETAGLPAMQQSQNDLRAAQTAGIQSDIGLANFFLDNRDDGRFTVEQRAAAMADRTGTAMPDASLLRGAVRPRARPAGLSAPAQTSVQTNRGLGNSAATTVPRVDDAFQNYAKGTARVPGKGSPKKDTVKAKLAPGEAVLNAEAAETMGRGLIAALNQMGAQKMGLV